MPCRAVRYFAVLCRAVPCCAVLHAVVYLLFRSSRYHSTKYHTWYSSTEIYHARFVRITLLNHKKMHSQLSSAQISYTSAARSAALWGAVRRRALPCGAVLCRAALCFLSGAQVVRRTISCEVPSARYRYVRVYSSFCFLHSVSCLSVLFMLFFFANFTCTADHNMTSPTRTQHSRGQSALQKSSWHFQIANRY